MRLVTLIVATILLSSFAAEGQWLDIRLSGTPRTSDGKPNLFASVPRTREGKPDLGGIWSAESYRDLADVPLPRRNIAAGIQGGAPLTEWARPIRDERRKALGLGVPSERCLPVGLPFVMLQSNLPFKIIQTPLVTIVLLEEFNNWRQIHTDGRSLPEDPQPTWLGYSVGHWDDDVLVVTTSGFNDQTWLDGSGTPHSEQLRLTERFRRSDFGHMEIEYTFDDPKAFTKRWSTTVKFQLMPDTELLEHHCENEKFISRVKK